MSYYSDNNTSTVMPVAPMNTNNSGFGWGGDGSFWIIILFLFAMFNGGWGGFGFGGNGYGAMPYMMNQGTNSDIQRSFDQQSVMGGINGLTAAVNSGFGNVQTSLCNGFAGVNAGVANGFAQAEIANNSRQMANMNQLYGIQSGVTSQINGFQNGVTNQMYNLQTGIGNQLNTIAMNQQNNCCENRAAVADLKYTVATEACADRTALDGALRDVTAQGVANTTALMNTINGGIQSIKDQLCQYRDDQKNETISDLRQQLAMKDLAASQAAQNAFIQQGFTQEVDNLYNRLNNCPVPTTPVYGRTPIFTCGGQNPGFAGCGCGMNA